MTASTYAIPAPLYTALYVPLLAIHLPSHVGPYAPSSSIMLDQTSVFFFPFFLSSSLPAVWLPSQPLLLIGKYTINTYSM